MKTCNCNQGVSQSLNKPKVKCESKSASTRWANLTAEYWQVALSFTMLVLGIAVDSSTELFTENRYIPLLWYSLTYLPVGLPVIKEAWESILHKDIFSEFTLMSMATIGAFVIGEYPEGVAVMLFYSIGELFQNKAINRAKQSISKLMDVRPDIATVIRDEIASVVSPREVKKGEIIEVRSGERVPLDGLLKAEKASFNTSALTGESIPRTFKKGDEVLAGMISTDSVIRIKVTKRYDQSALSRILQLVQEAAERKAPAELFIRKFARIYTPIVTLLAILIILAPLFYSYVNPSFTYNFYSWFYRSLVFLVISCPCALVVSIPLGYFGGIGAASRLGILFKGGSYLDAITKVNTVVFDKTGTLTNGSFEVKYSVSETDVDENELISLIASVEQKSNHPIAKAIQSYAKAGKHSLSKAMNVTEIAGMGLKATVNGKLIWVGNTQLLDNVGIGYPDSLNSIAETIVTCAVDGRYWGYLLLSDTIKEDAVDAIISLKELNISNIHILSGDKQCIVTKVADLVGVVNATGDLLPEGKVSQLEKLKSDPKNVVAFIGDGINDAPVLALSHVGIAMGGLGSDAAIETADVVIQTDKPSKVATAIKIGKHTRNIVWQNIALAFGVKVVVLILGAGGLATLWEAVFADVGVSLIAILNAVRIQKLLKL